MASLFSVASFSISALALLLAASLSSLVRVVDGTVTTLSSNVTVASPVSDMSIALMTCATPVLKSGFASYIFCLTCSFSESVNFVRSNTATFSSGCFNHTAVNSIVSIFPEVGIPSPVAVCQRTKV
ncbi:Uncharacterised protein [Streptococcus suis]|uniref:Uncharacterized protein n=1 Tax=Streptococcus suis TaxID=1307 RepID=A0A0Z8HJ50_STRSU|nr:Uncharacterised protein [Streptococcus suis]